MSNDAAKVKLFRWAPTFPATPDLSDVTATIEGRPGAFLRIYRAEEKPGDDRWLWVASDGHGIVGKGYATGAKAAARAAVGAWKEYVAPVVRKALASSAGCTTRGGEPVPEDLIEEIILKADQTPQEAGHGEGWEPLPQNDGQRAAGTRSWIKVDADDAEAHPGSP